MNRHGVIPFGMLVTALATISTTLITINDAQAQAAPSDLPRCVPVVWPANPDLVDPLQDWEAANAAPDEAFSDARIARLDNGKTYGVFGTDQGTQGGDGRARLFVVNLQEPADFVVLDTGVGHNSGGQCDATGSDCNALAVAELADINGDGFIDWAYAGDLHGNVWAFDLTSDNGVQNFTVTRLFSSCAEPLQPGDSCALAQRQPVSARVALARNTRLPGSVENPNINVYWGTGQLHTADDATDTSPQTFYSVLHTGQESGTSTAAHFHSDLVERAYSRVSGSGGGADVRSVDSTVRVNYRGQGGSRQYGWYIPLPESGERLLSRPVVAGELVIFNTMLPSSDGPCERGADGWLNVLSLADGLAPLRLVSADDGDNPGADADRQVLDYNEDGIVDAGDRVDDQTVLSVQLGGEAGPARVEGDMLEVDMSDGSGSTPLSWRMRPETPGRAGRVGWYQLR